MRILITITQDWDTNTKHLCLSTEVRRDGAKALKGSWSLQKEDLGKTGDPCIKISLLAQNFSSVDYADAQLIPTFLGFIFAV